MKQVILYTQPDCPPCSILKRFFSENEIPFTEKNIREDAKAMKELTATYQSYSTPTNVIDGKAIIGFELEKLMEALEISETA